MSITNHLNYSYNCLMSVTIPFFSFSLEQNSPDELSGLAVSISCTSSWIQSNRFFFFFVSTKILVTNHLHIATSNSRFQDGISLDLSLTFGRVNHSLILEKFSSCLPSRKNYSRSWFSTCLLASNSYNLSMAFL